MPEAITPEWLEACGFRKSQCMDHRLQRCDVELNDVTITVIFEKGIRQNDFIDVQRSGNEREIEMYCPARSDMRAIFRAFTGTRLVEPMPTDIAESTLILADKYEEDGFGDQAAYIRSLVSENERLKREVDELARVENRPIPIVAPRLNLEQCNLYDATIRGPLIGLIRNPDNRFRIAEPNESPHGWTTREQLEQTTGSVRMAMESDGLDGYTIGEVVAAINSRPERQSDD